jgi:hypothetical protein
MTVTILRPHVGIALAADRLVATLRNGRSLETKEVGDLRTAFIALQEATRLTHATVSVALVPPLVRVRHTALPPLRESERHRLLERDAARYFVGLREQHVTGSVVLARKKSPVPVFVAAAPARLVEEIEAAVSGAGWTLAAIVPAQSAWAAIRDGQAVISLPHGNEVLRVAHGRVLDRRLARAGDPLPEARDRFQIEDPVTSAAAHAAQATEPDLCSPQRLALRQHAARQVAGSLAGTAFICIMLAVAVNYWGLERQLAAARQRRSELATSVAAAMQLRDSIATVSGALTAIRRIEQVSPRWSTVLADLADYLPRDAYVVQLHGEADSVVMQGVAAHAIGVFQALQVAPNITGLRAEAPIRQDVGSDGAVREQFSLGAFLKRMP